MVEPNNNFDEKPDLSFESPSQNKPSKITTIKPIIAPTLGTGIVGLAELAANDIVDKAETGTERGDIIFEPGLHNTPQQVLDEGFQSGENIHGWNSEVSGRIASYQPVSVAIDSLFPINPGFVEGDEQDVKKAIWFALPDRADGLNRQGSLYVVAGDFMGAVSSITEFPGVENQEELKTRTGENFEQESSSQAILELAERSVIKPVLGVALGYALLYKRGFLEAVGSMNRRDFLKFLGGVGLSTAFYRLFDAPERSARAQTQVEKNLSRAVQQAFKNNLVPDDVTNGRTALLIEKQEQVLKYLKANGLVPDDSKGSVLIGNAHNIDSFGFVNNPEMRLAAISRLGESLIGQLKRAGKDGGFSESDIAIATTAILDYLASTQVWQVTDSGEKFPVPDMSEYIDKHIELVDLEIPNPRIKNALNHLRP